MSQKSAEKHVMAMMLKTVSLNVTLDIDDGFTGDIVLHQILPNRLLYAGVIQDTKHLFFRLTNEGQFIPCGDVVGDMIEQHNLPWDWREWSGKDKVLASQGMERTRAFRAKKVFESWAAQREAAAKEKENREKEHGNV